MAERLHVGWQFHILALVAAGAVAGGCGEEALPPMDLDAGSECVFAEDCPDQGAGLGCVAGRCVPVTEPEQWSCLGDEPLAPGTGTHSIRLTVDEFLSEKPLEGVRVRVCDDIDCTTMIAGPFLTDVDGRVDVNVPSGFNGAFLTDKDGYLPTATIKGPVLADGRVALVLSTPEFLENAAHSFGITLPDFSTHPAGLLVELTGCPGFRNAGAQVNLQDHSGQIIRFYNQDGTVSATATSTDEFGLAFFFGVEQGAGSAVARSEVSQRLIGTQAAPTRIGWVTNVFIDAVANR